MKAKRISVVLPIALTGLSNTALGANVDNVGNNTWASPDTWTWQSDNENNGVVEEPADAIDFFRLTGLAPGSQAEVIFSLPNCADNGPIQLEAFNTTQVAGDNVTLNATLASIPISASCGSGNAFVAIPANGELGLKVTDTGSVDPEGYRITINATPAMSATPVPLAAWPVVPLLGAAGLAALRRKQKRPAEKQAA